MQSTSERGEQGLYCVAFLVIRPSVFLVPLWVSFPPSLRRPLIICRNGRLGSLGGGGKWPTADQEFIAHRKCTFFLLPWQFFLNSELQILHLQVSCLGCNLTFSLYLKCFWARNGGTNDFWQSDHRRKDFDAKPSVYEFKMAEFLFNKSASWEMCLMKVYVVMDIST